jgi:hypothetical protein
MEETNRCCPVANEWAIRLSALLESELHVELLCIRVHSRSSEVSTGAYAIDPNRLANPVRVIDGPRPGHSDRKRTRGFKKEDRGPEQTHTTVAIYEYFGIADTIRRLDCTGEHDPRARCNMTVEVDPSPYGSPPFR